MELKEILNLTFMGISLHWIITFLLKAIIIYILIRISTAIVKHFFRRSIRREGKLAVDKTRAGFLQQIIVSIIYVLGCTSILALIPGMEKVSTSILASAGIGAMAIGLASQEALANIVGGMFIVFSRPFKVGDFIMVDDIVTGTVMEITLRHTVVKNSENRMILIPNSTMNSATIVNSSFGDPATCSLIEVGVSYSTDLDRAIEVMREEIMKHPNLIDRRTKEEQANGTPQVMIRVTTLGDSSITLRAWAWAKTSGDAFALKCDSLKSIKERYDREGIEIPFPTFTQIVTKA